MQDAVIETIILLDWNDASFACIVEFNKGESHMPSWSVCKQSNSLTEIEAQASLANIAPRISVVLAES